MLAFSEKLPFAIPIGGCHLPLTICRNYVNILHATHRRLICIIEAPRYQSLCCSLHGPDFANGYDAISEYWAATAELIEKVRRKCGKLFVFADANCRIGFSEGHNDAIVGSFLDPEASQTFVGDLFVKFSRRMKLRTTATFPEMLDPSGLDVADPSPFMLRDLSCQASISESILHDRFHCEYKVCRKGCTHIRRCIHYVPIAFAIALAIARGPLLNGQ